MRAGRRDSAMPAAPTSFECDPSDVSLPHDEQVVEPPQKAVPLLRRSTVIAHLQRLGVPDDADDVHWLEACSPQAVEQLEADGVEFALAGFAAVDVAVADVQGRVAARFEDPADLREHLLHRLVVFAAA